MPAADAFGGGDMAWFRLTIGRRANADPKWLIPLICRMGHVTKKDIGAIRIFDHETKFEISRERETSFREAVKAAGDQGDVQDRDPPAPPDPQNRRPARRPGGPKGGRGNDRPRSEFHKAEHQKSDFKPTTTRKARLQEARLQGPAQVRRPPPQWPPSERPAYDPLKADSAPEKPNTSPNPTRAKSPPGRNLPSPSMGGRNVQH